MNPKIFKIWMFIVKRLPLLWQCKIATSHIGYNVWKRNMKDKYFGKLKVVVLEVNKDWKWYTTDYGSYHLRDITYRFKRSKLPWFSTRACKGTQLQDETAHPLRELPHSELLESLDSMKKIGLRFEAQRNLHDAFKNPTPPNHLIG